MSHPEWTIPGKVMLFGEYAVLFGGTACMIALKPKYKAHKGKIIDSGLGPGFGSSVAEWVSLHVVDQSSDVITLVQRYRDAHSSETVQPSAADLAVQYEGGAIAYRLEQGKVPIISKLQCDDSFLSHFWLIKPKSLVKEKTYLNLRQEQVARLCLDPGMAKDRELCVSLTHSFRDSFSRQDFVGLKTCIESYISAFRDFETPNAKAYRLDLALNEDVFIVKGCGAGFNDVYLVVTKKPVLEDFFGINYNAVGRLDHLLCKEGASL